MADSHHHFYQARTHGEEEQQQGQGDIPVMAENLFCTKGGSLASD
jgi:hypothetical protein